MQKRYLQDKHFFGFVSNAAAAAENLVYSVYVLALDINGEVLTDKSLKASRSEMLIKIRAVNRLHRLGDSLQGSFDGSIPSLRCATPCCIVDVHQGTTLWAVRSTAR